MGGRIDCYLDTASFFSYVAFADLLGNLDKLAALDVEVEFHPILLAGINNLTGNKPPGSLPVKAKYLKYDSHRAAERVSKPDIESPPDFMSRSLTTSPQRALRFIKANYPTATFQSAMHFFYHKFWTPPHVNLTKDDSFAAVLAEATETPEGGRRLFDDADVARIMAGRASMKETLAQETAKVVEMGAFGAPWLWVTNSQGKAEPFFGSDRFNHIYHYLGVPYQDVALLPPSKL